MHILMWQQIELILEILLQARFGENWNKYILDLKWYIYNNGPVAVGLMVYEDLYSYQSGIYEYVTGSLISGHSIRCGGLGHDSNGNLYWIC